MLKFRNHNKIKNLCQSIGIKNYDIDEKGFVSVDGDVFYDTEVFKKEKLLIRFKRISGDFTVTSKKADGEKCKITNLEGCPEYVGGDFTCYYNNLTSLKGCPKYVGKNFNCTHNNLTSLEGSPKKVGGIFYCNFNKLKNLEGISQEILRDIICTNNELISLKGCPEKITSIICSNNKLTDLKGGPKEVDELFDCSQNLIKSLEGSPIYVGGNFDCGNNKLTSLHGGPKYVGSFFCDDNFLETLEGGPIEVKSIYNCRNNKLINILGCPNYALEFNFIGNSKLFDLKKYPNTESFRCFGCPVASLISIFGDYNIFKKSIDYNYLRGNKIIKNRLRDSITELEDEMRKKYNYNRIVQIRKDIDNLSNKYIYI